ncbi:hypothetical protein [Silvibacterium sp.]|uniref:hypothetical protein n=1 Tax=Silvibacterium sp. TaxID=1964179 RepID=UPI0039E42908
MHLRKCLLSLLLCFAAFLTSASVSFAERPSASSSGTEDASEPGWTATTQRLFVPPSPQEKPFSRMAFSASVSPLGIGLTTATNVKPYMNLRFTGNVFGYTENNISTNGFKLNASMNLASTGIALDLYPFPRRGLRISPGLLIYNGNQVTASANVAAGSALTLNSQTYYSANTNAAIGETPLSGSAALKLNSNKVAYTMTLGWGNHVHPKRHLSFPFEIGAAFIGSPAVRMNLNGWACADAALQYCASVTGSNPFATQFQSALKAQQARWDSDLNPLQFYPVLSVGVAYSFGIRK